MDGSNALIARSILAVPSDPKERAGLTAKIVNAYGRVRRGEGELIDEWLTIGGGLNALKAAVEHGDFSDAVDRQLEAKGWSITTEERAASMRLADLDPSVVAETRERFPRSTTPQHLLARVYEMFPDLRPEPAKAANSNRLVLRPLTLPKAKRVISTTRKALAAAVDAEDCDAVREVLAQLNGIR